ncbi:MAG: hypothetical protein R3B71_03545 [Candidatus Gracilibacteria bacterium]
MNQLFQKLRHLPRLRNRITNILHHKIIAAIQLLQLLRHIHNLPNSIMHERNLLIRNYLTHKILEKM